MFVCVATDLGTTKRRKMTRTRALRLWEAHKGVCVICEMPIDGAREDWFIEHPRALELGGTDTDDNAGPAHLYHKAAKDADDHRRAAKAKRAKRVLLGIKPAQRRQIHSAGFQKAPPQRRATTPLARPLPPRRNPNP
jgi:5-methylcytosine-specific restriction protein A